VLDALHALPTGSLVALAASLRSGMLSAGITRFGVQQAAGADSEAVEAALLELAAAEFSPKQMSTVVQAIADTRATQPDVSTLFGLVLSGPDLPGVPTADTAAVVQRLIAGAEREILMVGYAVHNGRELFKPLAERMEATPSIQVTFCLDISRPFGDTSSDEEIVRRFATEFRRAHWPWKRVPRIYFDPRALIRGGEQRACLHAKCIVVDRARALVTSANFTEAAQHRNIEAGLLVQHRAMAGRIASYFEGLMARADLAVCTLPMQ
jgi:phosphatidylserine/phosphatidylglycerophosphate/cardiolipin synthase-like enzyme